MVEPEQERNTDHEIGMFLAHMGWIAGQREHFTRSYLSCSPEEMARIRPDNVISDYDQLLNRVAVENPSSSREMNYKTITALLRQYQEAGYLGPKADEMIEEFEGMSERLRTAKTLVDEAMLEADRAH